MDVKWTLNGRYVQAETSGGIDWSIQLVEICESLLTYLSQSNDKVTGIRQIDTGHTDQRNRQNDGQNFAESRIRDCITVTWKKFKFSFIVKP